MQARAGRALANETAYSRMNDAMSLFDENQKLVYYTISKYYPAWTNDEDIVQVGMIALWQACEAFDSGKGALSTFAVKYIRTSIHSYLRDCMKKPPSSVPFDDAFASGTASEIDGAPRIKDEYVDIDGLIKSLKPRTRLIIAMRSVGLSVYDIADALHCTPQNVSQVIRYAEKKIRNYI